MKKFPGLGRWFFLFAGLFIALGGLRGGAAQAQDQLLLCGRVTGVSRGKVIFEVESESCRGRHYLRVPSREALKALLAHKGERQCFMVQESTCQRELHLFVPSH